MKKIAILIAVVTMATFAQAYPLIVEAQRGPEIPVLLQYGVPMVVTEVHLPCRGKWTISGGATVQMNVTHPEWGYVTGTVKPSAFLYTAAAFSWDENALPVDGTADLQADSYVTRWFPANPRNHTMLVDYDGADVYLVVMYYGQIPADYVQAFGSIMATVDIP